MARVKISLELMNIKLQAIMPPELGRKDNGQNRISPFLWRK